MHLPSYEIPRKNPQRFDHVVFADASLPRRDPIDLARYAIISARMRPSPPPSPADDEFLRWLFERAGLDCSAYRADALRRRLPACLRVLRVRSLAEARRTLQHNPATLNGALTSTLIGVTSFFRDPAVFCALTETLRSLAASRRRPLRIWSVGCSDGAELYSVAIILAEIGVLADTDLVGTDCRADAIAAARDARFDALALHHVHAERRARFFVRNGSRWRANETLRSAARFRVGNVLACCEPGYWDVILCRNLTIYLEDGAARELWRRLQACLRPGGALVVAKAERPDLRNVVPTGPCIYRRVAL